MRLTLHDAQIRAHTHLNERGIPLSRESVRAVRNAIMRQFAAWPQAGWAAWISPREYRIIGNRAASIVLMEHLPV